MNLLKKPRTVLFAAIFLNTVVNLFAVTNYELLSIGVAVGLLLPLLLLIHPLAYITFAVVSIVFTVLYDPSQVVPLFTGLTTGALMGCALAYAILPIPTLRMLNTFAILEGYPSLVKWTTMRLQSLATRG